MRRAGWIREAGTAGEAGGARRAYRIASEGRRRMREELARLHAVVAHARSRALLSRG